MDIILKTNRHKDNKISRAGFLRSLLLLSGIGTLLAWMASVSEGRTIHNGLRRVYLDDESAALSQGVVVTMVGNKPMAFLNRCTHLGCVLDRYPDGQLQCPCHGSAFRADGTVLKGPARRDLDRLEVHFDQENKTWYTEL